MIMTSPINDEGGGDGNNDGDYENNDESNENIKGNKQVETGKKSWQLLRQ